MANFAVIRDGIVENVILADSKEIAESVTQQVCIECDNELYIGIGWTFDGTNFNPPVVEEPVE